MFRLPLNIMTADDFIFADYAEYMVPPKTNNNGQPLCDLVLLMFMKD